MSDVHRVASFAWAFAWAIRGRSELGIDAEGADREAKGTSKLQRLQLSLSADNQRRRCELDASDRQLSTGLVRGGKPRPFIPARRWVVGQRVRLEKKGRRRHKCGCGRVWKRRSSGFRVRRVTSVTMTPTSTNSDNFRLSPVCAYMFFPYSHQPSRFNGWTTFVILSVFLPTTNG